MRIVLSILFLSISLASVSQSNIEAFHDSLRITAQKIYSTKADEEKRKLNDHLMAQFDQALSLPNSFSFDFDSLKDVGRLRSPDNLFRIICWNLPLADGTFDYFGFIQVHIAKTNSYKVFKLTNKTAEIKNPETFSGDHNKWFGMLYYKIIPVKYKGKTYYTLLGWEGRDRLTTRKIIEVVSFSKEGVPRFGDQVFAMDKKSPKRMVFEYSEQASMSLRYDEQNNMIIFDHLAPLKPHLEGQYQYYGPDFSVDAFGLKKGKWVYIPDVDARNPKDKMDSYKPGERKKEKAVYEPK